MKYSKGSVAVFIVIAIVVVSAGITGALYINKDETVNDDNALHEKITADVLQEIRKSGVLDNYEITVNNSTLNHARLTLIDPKTRINKTLFAVNITGEWRVVKTDDIYSCERMVKLGFPGDLIDDCTLEYPDAITVADAIDTLTNSTDKSLPVQILGTVIIPKELACDCVYIESGGEQIEVSLGNSTGQNNPYSNLSDGDTVAISGNIVIPETVYDIETVGTESEINSTPKNVYAEDSNTDSDVNLVTEPEPIIVPVIIEEVGEEDSEIFNDQNDFADTDVEDISNNTDNDTNGGYVQDNQTIPPEPNIETSNSSSNDQDDENSFFNIFDLNKNNQIQLKND